MIPDHAACHRALSARDPRFDGRIFVGVTTTGIYCRPVCPATTPKPDHCRFFPTAAGAQSAGFRPCLRCRPETAPHVAAWRGSSATVSRALELIDRGALDTGGVEALSGRLGLGSRQLRRLFTKHLGATPVAVAQTRRVLFAKQLLQETRLPMAEVSLAAGFGSVRRFNEVFRELYDRPPSELRRLTGPDLSAATGVTLRLRYRGAYDWDRMLCWLAARAIEGVEEVADGRWRRTVRVGGAVGSVDVGHEVGQLVATVRTPSVAALPELIRRIRRVFDLHADQESIEAHFRADPRLAPLVEARPGLRCPGAWDGFETGIRVILGQQISVAAAARLAVRLVELAGTETELGWVFPTAEQLVGCDLDALGMPGARRRALRSLAQAWIADPAVFDPGPSLEDTVRRLVALPGIGPWSAQMIALRVVREPDAFPASDLGLLRALQTPEGRPSAAELEAMAEAWRPWRAAAAQHLWTHDEERP